MALRVPPNHIAQIIEGRRTITADTALRLGRYFGVNPQFWLNLQSTYELRAAARGAPLNRSAFDQSSCRASDHAPPSRNS